MACEGGGDRDERVEVGTRACSELQNVQCQQKAVEDSIQQRGIYIGPARKGNGDVHINKHGSADKLD